MAQPFALLTVTVLTLHDRLLQAGVWGTKVKTLVLLFLCFQTETSCSLCKPEKTFPSHIFSHYLSSPQILLLLSLLICTKYLFPVIIREETGVRGRSLLSLALWTNPNSGQYLPRSWVFREWMAVSVCRCLRVLEAAGMLTWAAAKELVSCKNVFISIYLMFQLKWMNSPN